MKFTKYIKLTGALTILAMSGLTGTSSAKENVVTTHHKDGLKATASSGCIAATAAIDMDINNVRARLMTGGDMWWNIGLQTAAYEIPKGSGKSSQFAASCWIGGFDKQGQLKVAAQTYRQDGNDYWPGALNTLAKITPDTCALWDRFWKVDKATINQFIQMSKSGADVSTMSQFNDILHWPAYGNTQKVIGADGQTQIKLNSGFTYAPFKDLNGNGIYEPLQGEYPVLESNGIQSLPDELVWWVFNDAGNVKQQSLTAAIGVEVQTTAFAFATQDFLNDATFYNYRVINRGALTIDSTYIAVWDDCDLGWYLDDYIGCDTSRGLGIQYNGTNDDGGAGGHPVNSYGLNPPQVGLDFFQGPLRPIKRTGLPDTVQRLGMTNFTYYNNDASTIGNPTNGIQIYNYMTGSIRNGQRFSNDFVGCSVPSKGYGGGQVSNFVFWGDPSDCSQWSECACKNNPSDRRFIFSSGPFELRPGAINDITFGCIWANGAGGCPNTSFKAIKNLDDQAQALFDDHFKTVEGPQAPLLSVRELDRKLVFYITNPSFSNNYGENYGRTDGTYKDSIQYHQVVTKAVGKPDSLYRFEGYRVFQLANSQVTSAEIFDPVTGEVDNTKAVEVFQCDVHNGVSQIVNYAKNNSVNDPLSSNTYPQIKVNGKDSGITHSFVISQDKFAAAGLNWPSDSRLVNYHTYYFVAIAYAYNNFAQFDPTNVTGTQDAAYLGSTHAAGGSDIQIIAAMPNPADSAMGTILNSDYGSGVAITRMEGVGNGGNDVELSDSSEAAVLRDDSIAKATYLAGRGPIEVKVIDPVRVKPYTWALQIKGYGSGLYGLADSSKWQLSVFNGNTKVETIYSETDITTINEQILSQYGISVSLGQVTPPGKYQSDRNGYITSEIKFADSTKSWLWGLTDQADSTYANWIRAGNNHQFTGPLNQYLKPCGFNDNTLDSFAKFENLLSNFSPARSTWAPYVLVAPYAFSHAVNSSQCPFEFAYTPQTQTLATFATLPDIDIVFTADKTKWTRCAVVEQQDDPGLAEGFSASDAQSKFLLRRHKGWDGEVDPNNPNLPLYSDDTSLMGMSWFPGYAIDEGTGRRLNIVFGEDSYLSADNGNDMIWNPTSSYYSTFDYTPIFGGKHVVYVLGTKYDSCRSFANTVKGASTNVNALKTAYSAMQWVGVPIDNPSVKLLSIKDGIIPTTTRIRFRVNRPYAPFYAVSDTSISSLPGMAAGSLATDPYYTFSTGGLEPTFLSDKSDKKDLLSRIYAVPNPYYGYSGYEANRFETKVRIINLPAQATIYIYTLDGELIRTLTKNDNSSSYIDWDIKNSAGLPIASGMYLMDVKAVGIGETVLKWFGAMRPIDVTSY